MTAAEANANRRAVQRHGLPQVGQLLSMLDLVGVPLACYVAADLNQKQSEKSVLSKYDGYGFGDSYR